MTPKESAEDQVNDEDAILLPYTPPDAAHRTETPLDRNDPPGDNELVRVAWAVERHAPTGEWELLIYEIGSAGDEELLAELPLDPDTAAEMSSALAASYQDMTGDQAPRPTGAITGNAGQLSRWWNRSGGTNSERVRVAILVALLLIVIIAFIGNVVADWF